MHRFYLHVHTCLTQSSLKENWIMNRWMATTLSLPFYLLKITKKHLSLWVDTTRKIHHSCHHACRASRSPMICSTALLVLVSVSCSGHSFLHTVPLLERLFNMHYSGVCHSSCRYPNMSIMQTVTSGHLCYIFWGVIALVREWTGGKECATHSRSVQLNSIKLFSLIDLEWVAHSLA